MIAKDYQDLLIWQKADQLARLVFLASRTFPKEELYSLTSQITRSSLSVPTNIVEGFYRTQREFLHFLVIAVGSLKETEYLAGVALERGYIEEQKFSEIMGLVGELSKMLSVFMKSISTRSLAD